MSALRKIDFGRAEPIRLTILGHTLGNLVAGRMVAGAQSGGGGSGAQFAGGSGVDAGALAGGSADDTLGGGSKPGLLSRVWGDIKSAGAWLGDLTGISDGQFGIQNRELSWSPGQEYNGNTPNAPGTLTQEEDGTFVLTGRRAAFDVSSYNLPVSAMFAGGPSLRDEAYGPTHGYSVDYMRGAQPVLPSFRALPTSSEMRLGQRAAAGRAWQQSQAGMFDLATQTYLSGGSAGQIAAAGDFDQSLVAVGGAAAGLFSVRGLAVSPRPVPEGVVYSRIDLNGGVLPYGGQAQNEARFLQRQIEHARSYPNADFEFTIVGRANPGVDLDVAEHQYIQQLTGGRRASTSPLVSNLKDPIGAARRSQLGLPEPSR